MLGYRSRRFQTVVYPSLLTLGVPVHAISVCVIMILSARPTVPMAESKPDMLPVFLIGPFLSGYSIAPGSVLGPVNSHSIYGEGHSTSLRCHRATF